MILTNQTLGVFYNGQMRFVQDGVLYLVLLNGQGSMSVSRGDFGVKTLTINPIMVCEGNLPPHHAKQMWRKVYGRFSALSFSYYDCDVYEKGGKLYVNDETNVLIVLYPPSHPECIRLGDIIEPPKS